MQATIRIPGYDSLEQIALGGMAAVYKARKTSLRKPVAIKLLYPHLAANAVFIERFKREAEAAAKVQHENIVNVIDYGECGDTHYIVMEYCDGVTLAALLEEHGAVPPDVGCAILLDVCCGLEAAHSANLVHRDIKPANIMLTRRGGVKVADFGLAKTVDSMQLVTQHGKVIGTPAYMSPEQTRGDNVGPQSDVFSLGVVAYELLTGRRPFEGRNYAEVVDRIQSDEPEAIYLVEPLVSSRVARIVEGMLEKDLSRRTNSVGRVARDLEVAVDQCGYRRDRKMLSEYLAAPESYRASHGWTADAEPESGPTARPSCGADAAGPSSRPSPDGSEQEAADTGAEYRVILESLDRTKETPASFALKLSMSIRSPLPRVVGIVKNMPASVGGHLSLRKASKLVHVIQELGGTARMEPELAEGRTPEPVAARERKGAPKDSTEPARGDTLETAAPKRTPPTVATTAEFHPIDEHTAEVQSAGRKSALICPKCGWEADAEARFCAICLFPFEKTETLSFTDLHNCLVTENPLAQPRARGPRSVAGCLGGVRNLPRSVKIAGFVGLAILLALVVFGR
jgi:serine/threonine protein kinase